MIGYICNVGPLIQEFFGTGYLSLLIASEWALDLTCRAGALV